MSFVVVIPARYASERLPGKPLRSLAGRPLIRHVFERARASAASQVLVATDSEAVASACRGFGAPAVMTSPAHRSGTERIAEVADALRWPDDTIVVNVQGDEPEIPPAIIDQVAALLSAGEAAIATLSWPVQSLEEYLDPNVVKVVCDGDGHALYFSRAPIPWHRDGAARDAGNRYLGAARHVGLYAYRAAALRRLAGSTPCALEETERLEQLRALWLGLRIRVAPAVVEPGHGVDTEDDLARAERRMAAAGGGALHGSVS